MNKKIIRIFISVCFILVMTATTAFASSKSRYFHYNISDRDRIVEHCDVSHKNAYLTGHVNVVRTDGTYTLELNDVNFQGYKADASEYSYSYEFYNDDHSKLYLYILRNGEDIGSIHFLVSSTGHLRKVYHNY